MPEDTYDDDNEETNEEDDRKVTLSRSQIRALEKRPKVEDFSRVQRENALLRLGIDVDSAAGKMLLGNTDLDWDKPESIKDIAVEAGLLKIETTSGGNQKDEQIDQELNQSQERSDLGRGSASDDGKPRTDPRTSAAEEARAAMAKGAREEEALGHFIHRLAEAAQNGDSRVIIR